MAQFEDHLPYFSFGVRYLKFTTPHMRGTDVKVLQHLYNDFQQHVRKPIGSAITEDGVYGSETRDAIHGWQRYFNLQVNGIVGPETGATFGQYDPAYGGPRFGSRGLSPGIWGGDVIVLQNRLNCFRYSQYTGHAATNGDFDAGTREAVRHFQSDMNSLGIDPGVPVDGAVHFETGDALWAYTWAGGRGLFSGRNGIDTLWIQHYLVLQGYANAEDGFYGDKTRAGVEAFQRAHGITVDGVVGSLTFYVIGQHNALPAGSWG